MIRSCAQFKSALAAVCMAACGSSGGPTGHSGADASSVADSGPGGDRAPGAVDAAGGDGDGAVGGLALPPANGAFDYQLGGAYAPPVGVSIVSRDRGASPAAGLYSVCYVNGFQIQPDEESMWLSQYPELILRDGGGDPVIDPDWDEMLIDVSTPAKRSQVAEVVGAWIDGCAAAGFQAVEIDNLDSFTRSGGLLSEADALATMRLFSDRAHAQGLPIAQKNAADLAVRRAELGTDFAVAEECNRYSECAAYTAEYGDAVLVIEYRRADFDAGCRDFPGLSIVLRDLDLVRAGQPGYVYDGC